MRNKFYLLLIIVASAIIIINTNLNKKETLKALPNITLTSVYNNQLLSINFADKFILQPFATWCTKCNEYNSKLLYIIKSNNLNIPVLGIAIKDSDKEIQKLYPKSNSPFNDIAHDTKGFILPELGIRGIPETFFIKDNIIVKRIIGGASEQDIINFYNE